MSYELLDTAEYLLARSGEPTSADACRAISTTYYALFHCLAKSCSDLFVGDHCETRPQHAWDQLYRSLSHAAINDRCGKAQVLAQRNFDQSLIDFAEFTKDMQWKRERCDYAYGLVPNVSAAMNDIKLARGHLNKFHALPDAHRRAFAVYLLVREDRNEKKFIAV